MPILTATNGLAYFVLKGQLSCHKGAAVCQDTGALDGQGYREASWAGLQGLAGQGGSRTKSPRTKPPRTKSPGQNPPDKIPLDKIPPRTKSPRTKSPWTKSPHYIPPNCSIAQYFLLYVNVIFEGQFSSTFVRCDIFHGHEVEKHS